MKRLENKTAVVTGGGGGIGIAVAEHFLSHGARCLVVDYSDPSEKMAELLDAHQGSLVFHRCDVSKLSEIESVVPTALAYFDQIDVLFNNAAVFDMAPFLESDASMYERIFSVNVKGMFFVMQAVAAHMNERGIKGSIINMASQAGRRGEALVSHYCASKAAVISYTQSAALAMSEQGTRVNAISPGVVDTPMWATVDALFAQYEGLEIGEKKKQVGIDVPMGRMGVPEDIAGAALFLASDESAYITGQTLNVDGGNVLS